MEKLKRKISVSEYEKYIKQLKYDTNQSKSDKAIFYAPNRIIANWIKTKYSSTIATLFEDETGIKPEIQFYIGKKRVSENSVKKEVISTTKPVEATSSLLNPSFTFENFIVGSSNQFAYSVAKSIIDKPAVNYNPLFIYAPTGLGKTHLMQAIGNEYIKKELFVIYVTTEQFMNDFTYHIRNQSMDRFRDKYRKADLLLIDDIQFLSGKIQTQDEFFHTFSELHNAKKQIVLTSDKPPKKIAGIEERLQSRFEWGITADIQFPEFETKIAIIKKKCELDGIDLANDVINYIATHMGENIREIEGSIINLNAYATLMHQEITIDFAKNVLKDQIKEKKERINIENIIKIISAELNIKPSEIRSKKRNKDIVKARRIAIYFARELTQNSMPKLADFFGMKDHTSVSHAMKNINENIETDENFKLLIEELKNKILTK